MPTDLEEQIWREEINRFSDDALALWKTQYRFWLRAKTQGAPVSLLNEMAQINELFMDANARLVKLAAFFPEAGD